MLSPTLNENLKTPLYEQLYSYIKKEIIGNNIVKDEKLPSKRSLAAHLGVSVNTISNAYELLLDEGYIYSIERRGYFVSTIDNLVNIKLSKEDVKLKDISNRSYKYNLKYNNVDTANFPLSNWRKSSLDVINEEKWLKAKDHQGLYPLRKCIAQYLYRSRNVKTKAENIIISSGLEYLFQILFYILDRDSIYAIENPGFKVFKDIFEKNNLKHQLIDIDEKGMSIEAVARSKANILCITPSHQFPTGVIMPIDRRIQLLNWANMEINRYIIEDDYDSEFKYYGRPIPALKSLDKSDRVIYLGNFSKSISSSLRISYMVLPDQLMNIYHRDLPFINCPVSSFSQLILSNFIENKYFERHLNRMRNIYKDKREFTRDYILKNNKKNTFKVLGSEAGLHFIWEIQEDLDEGKLLKELKKNGLFLESLSSYYRGEKFDSPPIRLLIGFAGHSKRELREALDLIFQSLEKLRKP